MSIVRPFRGLRSKLEFARSVASPPYDVLNAKEARVMAEGNPNSFLRVNKSELEFDDTVNPYSDEVYKRAKENLNKLENRGVMIRDPKPCFYLYRLTMSGRSQTGLVALTSVEEYDAGKIKKHEHTRPEKVEDRAHHISMVGAQVGPVFTTFRYNTEIDNIFKKITSTPAPTDFVADDGIRHELWVVSDNKIIADIIAAFGKLPELYIADGHHRSESAAELGRRMRAQNKNHTGQEPYNFFINVLFPDKELAIMPYNRVVKDLNGMTMAQFLEKIKDKFSVTPQSSEVNPRNLHMFGFYCEGKWFQLTAKEGTFDPSHPTKSIDASVLADNLIGPVLGITNPRTDKRIDFVGGIRGTKELVRLVDSGEFKAAFSLFPTTIEQLLNVADRGEVMPPKSTWFEPKLRDGMVVYLLTD
ncbi:MAG TPA: DUF1015 domain-containing protein [candidate division Zixibacteria bacterium]|nr:DUF1015 domain-containing protein [candidate division Zixibacteria bacterium]